MTAIAASPAASTTRRIPLPAKIAFSAFVAVLVPYYWNAYGPTNFLYFCDVALFFALGAMWLESPLLASMPAVGILLPQSLWMVDFLAAAVGVPLTGMTGYMFDESIPLFTRGLSFFHFWLPILLAWLVWRLGYDRRACRAWTILASGLVLVCYFFLPAPPAPADNPLLPVNVNYVYGFGDRPQTWMPQNAYVALMLIVLAFGIYWPTHWILSRVCRAAEPAPGETRS